MSGSQKKDQEEDKHSSEAPSNFCPTSHGVIKEGIRSVQHGNRSAKSECRFDFSLSDRKRSTKQSVATGDDATAQRVAGGLR